MTIVTACAAIDALSKANSNLHMKVETLTTERDTARAQATYGRS